jgi:hypothetical protein
MGVNTGIRFRKSEPRAAPMLPMPLLQAMKAATEARVPT